MAESKCDWAKLIFDGATTQTSTLPKLDDWVHADDGDEEEGGDDWEYHINPPQRYYPGQHPKYHSICPSSPSFTITTLTNPALF